MKIQTLSNTNKSISPIIILDVETTGLHPINNDIIEIGALKTDMNGKIIDIYHRLANPGCTIPYNIIKLTGITNEMVKNERPSLEILKEFNSWANDDESFLVAHNAPFDIKMIFSKLKIHNIKFENHFVFDTLIWCRKLLNFESNKLDYISEKLNFDKVYHRAKGDAINCARIFSYLIKTYFEIKSEEEMISFLKDRCTHIDKILK